MKTLMMTAVLATLSLTAIAADNGQGVWHRFAAYDVSQREVPCPMMEGKPRPYMKGDEPCMKERPCPMKDGKPCPHMPKR